MQVYLNDTNALSNQNLNTAVALGRFDAMHKGHIAIIKEAVEFASKNGIRSLVYMFINDPLEITSGKKIKSVNTLSKRLNVLESLGVDIVVAEDFTRSIMNVTCEEFVNDYLVSKFGAKYVSVGYNYRFGLQGRGDTHTLKTLCEQNNIKVCRTPEITQNGKTVSSTAIRQKITDGDVLGAAELLGRYFSISGEVVIGNRIGSSVLNFPTANIAVPSGVVTPKAGVYITRTYLDGLYYNSVTNVGARPTVGDENVFIETHIDAQLGELYGKTIEVEFCEYIRGIIRFDTVEELIAQLKSDREKQRKFFEEI